ncbi:MAG: hypothetical protein IPP15_06060 [Saprospiraceae bacterium]|uniref:Uncharacterized protein n=1 Tax=Candidatus Opimibacter skivensis TaxID=2982028 RepID=A0A9D7SUJ5_9BACT|nr:hypothetical protein [Candidatus Opimibacter skivensis]
MKNSTFSKPKTIHWTIKSVGQLLIIAFFLFSAQVSVLHAQASLSIQGILKKSNGVAVEDGTYNITFKLYTLQAGGTPIWTETQSGVEVTSGIYSTILGNTTALNVPFNQLYYLGVTIGSSEMTPRIQLTSAPYALSLIGVTNQFPSSGLVLADSIKVIGSVLARGGAPGLNGANKNGYAFSGNSGDKDSGLFSTADGKVALYSNNTEVLAVTPANVAVTGAAAVSGNVSAANLALPNGGKVTYNGLSDWRLVVDDNLIGGANGWNVYNALSGQYIGWNNSSSAGAAPIEGVSSNFAGLYMYPTDNNQVLKKFFDLSGVGAFTFIKVKFKFYFIDTWGWGGNDAGWAAFADGANGSQMRVGWHILPNWLNATGDFNTTEFHQANNFEGNGNTDHTDFSMNAEMTTFKSGNSFWLYFGGALDEDTNNERYGVGMIEIWVR